MTLAFVVTGLAVLWEINLSVLYRGWGEGRGDDGVALVSGKGKGKAVYLFLVSILDDLLPGIASKLTLLGYPVANDIRITRIRQSKPNQTPHLNRLISYLHLVFRRSPTPSPYTGPQDKADTLPPLRLGRDNAPHRSGSRRRTFSSIGLLREVSLAQTGIWHLGRT